LIAADYDVSELQAEIKALAKERNAVILAHNYERPEVQDVADYVGDSLGLSREAAKTSADIIVFCGVHFMAETAAVLSPQKKVLLPDMAAGCSLAATIDGDDLRAWKAEHRGAIVVSYVNTTADVKAKATTAARQATPSKSSIRFRLRRRFFSCPICFSARTFVG
jgi:quinolinate synthase